MSLSVCVCVCVCAVAVKYNSCYAQPATSASIKRCNKTYHMEKELTARTSDDVCRYASPLSVLLYLLLHRTARMSVCLYACLSVAFTPQLS